MEAIDRHWSSGDDVDDYGQRHSTDVNDSFTKWMTSLGQHCQDSPREFIGDGDDDVMVLVDITHLVNNAIASAALIINGECRD